MPSSSLNAVGPAAFYTNRGRGRGNNYNRGRGRGSHQNRSQGSGGFRPNPGQFSWASNQNTVYGTCNRCGIGHLPSQCPNRDPSTFRSRQPSANYADTRSQASSQWLPDTGSSNHVAPDMTNFDFAEPYYGDDNLHVGNGHVYTHYPPHGSK
ncbi:putative transcription factor interactor and regulator CCHC(Zn) family [Helianthus annuus]|nr:putative transcription factor interactor and regulator CCHC(Zn) family [Helianthus annuus]